MAGMLLTDSKIKGIKSKDQAYYVWQSSATRGTGRLGLKIYPSGRKVFVYKYHKDGSRKFLTLGDYPNLTLAQATAKSLEAAGKISEQEPVGIVNATLKQLFVDYIEDQKRRGKRSFEKTNNRLNQVLKSPHVSPDMLAKDVTPTHVKMILSEAIQRSAIAGSNKIRTALHAVFNFALHADNDPANLDGKTIYGLAMNPASVVPKQAGAEKALDRFLTWHELGELILECNKPDVECTLPPDHALLTLLCIFTGGQRPWELMTNLKSNWDESNNTLTVPPAISKNGDYHVIPLSKSAIAVLEKIKKRHPDSSFLFPADTKEGHILTSEFAKQINKFCKKNNFDKFTPRDIRRTFKTLGGEMGISLEMRDRIQNHKKPGVATKHYDRYDYLKEKREFMEMWESKLKTL